MIRFFKTYYLLIFSALMLSLSRLPLYLGWLAFFAFIPLLFYFKKGNHSILQNIISALIFCLIQILIVFYWIGSVTMGGLLGIWLLYSLYYWIAFIIVERVWLTFPKLKYSIFVAVFISFEFLQNFGEMRFPWWNIGYSLADYLGLLQALELGGLSLLAFLLLSFNYLFYLILLRNRWPWFIIGLGFLFWYSLGQFRLLTLPTILQNQQIGIMQPSIVQDDKWDVQKYQEIMRVYDDLCTKASLSGFHLLIFPEAAIPDYLLLEQSIRQDFQDLLEKHQLAIFTGFPHIEEAPKGYPGIYYYYNAAALFKPNMPSTTNYYKNILVPVGERMLFLDQFPFLWNLQFGQANWEFGTKIPRYQCAGKEFSPSICYELAFPHFMQRANYNTDLGTLRKADFHVNITNDAWFGTSYGPWLHATMTKFRAIESRIQIYRSANTGISMIVNPKGEIIRDAGLFERVNITAPLYTSNVITLYHRIYHYPWIFVCFTVVFTLLSIFIPRRAK
ncbi:MAG: apolipoprotein N-acyltransferase [Candidatus Cloacimonetes bacterium]|nr:apolipoprotein N-acyltransferase [Candidatus Cloacimonadota bacterium]